MVVFSVEAVLDTVEEIAAGGPEGHRACSVDLRQTALESRHYLAVPEEWGHLEQIRVRDCQDLVVVDEDLAALEVAGLVVYLTTGQEVWVLEMAVECLVLGSLLNLEVHREVSDVVVVSLMISENAAGQFDQ